MAGAVYLSELLRPRGVPLPAILAQDVDAECPWLLLERLPGADLGSVITALKEEMLDGIASKVACSFASRFQPVLHFEVSLFRYRYSSFINGFSADEWIRVK